MRRVTLRGLAAHPLRTALTALAIVLGVALVTAAFTLTDTQRRAADALSLASYEGTDAVVSAKTAFDLSIDGYGTAPTVDAALLERVRSAPGVEVAAGDLTDYNTNVVGKDGKPIGDGPYFGVGLDSRAQGIEDLTPFRLRTGRWATGPGQVVLDVTTAEKAGYGVGDRARIAAGSHVGEFEITGIATFGPVESLGTASAAIFDLGTAQTLYGKEGRFDSILAAGDTDAAQVRRSVAGVAGAGVEVTSAAKHDRFTLDGLEQFIGIIRVILVVFGLIAVLVGAFTIVNTLSITIAQRTRELGLLRMIGASRGQVLRAVLGEALLIGLGASIVGLAAGHGLAGILKGLFASLGMDLPDAGTVFATRTVVVALLVGTLATVLAGLVPARRATRIAPVEALQVAARGGAEPGPIGRALRAFVSLLGRPAAAVGGVSGRLARRNAMRAPGRTGATAAAMIIGVALATTLMVVAQGLKDSVRSQLGDQVAATHVVVADDGWSPIDAGIARELETSGGVRAASSIRQDAALAFGEEESVNAVDPRTITQVFDFEWERGSSAVLAGLGSDGAVVDSGWAKEHGLDVGDSFAITSPSGRKLSLEVKGIERSPVIDAFGFGPITIGRAAFDGAFENQRNRYTFVSASETGALKQVMASHPEAKALPKAEYVDEAVASVDPLVAVLGILLALCVIVSLFGIVNALVLATFERTRELGTLRALGMTRRQMRRMVRHESVITALLGAAMGIVVGLGLAGAVTSAFSDVGLRFAVPGAALIAFTVVAIAAGIGAAVLPARRAARLDPLNALAYE